jgi:hypothetical protein
MNERGKILVNKVTPLCIKIDISIKPNIVEEITLGATCSLEEILAYRAIFHEYRVMFYWFYT